ncbi:cadmium resistance transporter [Limosilactobacillus reuteri]|jgi:cadmium resistance protein CadD (predicted permease)|uniref:Predicted permease, cadmium resistance protein n=1 Tax=Limosilactobacillus reuteri TaxID=1598 RepID=A0A0U5K0D7_LIMRT|nr:cadmium resistance transporter [Limosilactobacillus reuteri]NMV55125.1 permease [Limosilactobacillus reuteri]NMV57205.1 permease [Limosilactobacillus reuteri]CUR39226.1 Predicted permease, cadmium resistance protein [Limosilactobacillus reuteri subsp. porcinus]CUR41957.1 Predicted permease, cadmium resistance protein [Limosilactobacillus reuteri]
MSLIAILLIFVGLNIDTFIALLFLLRNYNYRLPILGFGAATFILWILGVALGKGLAFLFPDWITGFMGIVLIFIALFEQDDEKKTTNTGFFSLLLFCLSLGGDNLAVYIPWVVNLSWSQIIYVGIIFEICSVLLILLGKLFISVKPVAYLLEKYGNYGSKIVYILAGLYIIWNSHLISHLIRIFN